MGSLLWVLLQVIGTLAVTKQRYGQNGTDFSRHVTVEVDANARSAIQGLNDSSPVDTRQILYDTNSTVFDIENIVFDELPPPPSDEDVYKFMSLNAVTPPQTPKKSNLVYFLHISKSAGSFFCDCGMKNGKNRGLGHFPNCHYLKQDRPMWGTSDFPLPSRDPHVGRTCSSDIAHLRHYGITLEGNENFVPYGGNLCPELYTAILLRSPIHRLVSHLVWILGDKVWAMTPERIFAEYPLLSDNYYVRSLRGGWSAFTQPFGAVGHDDLQRAKYNLRRFKQVLIVDADLSKRVLYRFGWSCAGIPGKRSIIPGGTEGVLKFFKARWGEGLFQQLVHRNKLDIELFEEARRLQRASELSR